MDELHALVQAGDLPNLVDFFQRLVEKSEEQEAKLLATLGFFSIPMLTLQEKLATTLKGRNSTGQGFDHLALCPSLLSLFSSSLVLSLFPSNPDSALSILSSINLDFLNAAMTEEQVMAVLAVAEAYLEVGDAVGGEKLTSKITVDTLSQFPEPLFRLKFDECSARLEELKLQTMRAALKYYSLSLKWNDFDFAKRLLYLKRAVVCGILSKVSPERSRLLSNLTKDERCSHLPVLSEILFRTQRNCVISAEEIERLRGEVPDHMKGVVLGAMREHNLGASGELFRSVSFPQLGRILGVSEADAHDLVATVMAEGRMLGYIDQVNNFVHFDHGPSSIKHWNKQIEECCNSLNDICESIDRSLLLL
eukprot:TRINITY_DN9794_c0_g1_i1.p1 TRINITY_DN9794_c0_g1~~TRINITY_DN9794_c0_g1_i1.p1  ORF type:complete len:379 (-),score=131.43 TRINITY_DN9794_c0_g1_i1:26-1117(-)